MNIDVLNYGAFGDGIHDDTMALQKAIDECSRIESGVVFLKEGKTYLTGGLLIKSNVKIYIEKDCILKGNGIWEACIVRPGPFESLSSKESLRALLYIDHAKGVEICGEGMIDGNFYKYTMGFDDKSRHYKVDKYPRPEIVYAEECQDLRLHSVSLCNSPFWTIHIAGCNNTVIDKVSIINDMCMPNTDGIDIDRCKNTLIQNCMITTGDDAICPKLTEETAHYGSCEKITVRSCKLISQSSAIKFGSSSLGRFADCLFDDIQIISNRGIAFQIRDEGLTEDIEFKNIQIETKRYPEEWWGRGEPIYITTLPRNKDGSSGTIRNIRFENIKCKAQNGVIIYSREAGRIQNVCFHNVDVFLRKQELYSKGEYDLRPTSGEKVISFPDTPVVGVNISGIDLEAIHVMYENETPLSTP